MNYAGRTIIQTENLMKFLIEYEFDQSKLYDVWGILSITQHLGNKKIH
jgi:hypothetical protein